MGDATSGTGTHAAAVARVGPVIGVTMLSIENIIKLHDMGFSSEQIENINGLHGFEPKPNNDPAPEPNNDPAPEPNNDPAPEPNNDPAPEPKTNLNPNIQNSNGTFDMGAIINRLDAIEKTFKAAMVHSIEQPREMGVDDILSVILSPSGEALK